jgi:hypothetical protein
MRCQGRVHQQGFIVSMLQSLGASYMTAHRDLQVLDVRDRSAG